MSEATFQVGDEVEALPCDIGQHDHCVIAGRRGTVLVLDRNLDGVGVHFPGLCGNNLYGRITTNTGWFCAPAWLRHVPQDRRVAPRFKVGDWVVLESETEKVTRVHTEPRYSVETSRGVGEYIRESELRPDSQWRSTLLLTEAERGAASDRGACSGRADWMEEAERAVARAQAEKVLQRIVALLRERVKAQEHDGCADYWIDGDDLADELEALLKEGSA